MKLADIERRDPCRQGLLKDGFGVRVARGRVREEPGDGRRAHRGWVDIRTVAERLVQAASG
jgi:hypothetical protein